MSLQKKVIDVSKLQKDLENGVKSKGDLSKLKSSSIKSLGQLIIDQMLDLIASGISPITGQRFQAYKNPVKYPADRKSQRPVNLRLTNQFLNSLVFKFKTGKKPTITIEFDNSFAEDKESGHRDGVGGQPKRPIIPNKSEGFSQGIISALRLLLTKVVDKDLK